MMKILLNWIFIVNIVISFSTNSFAEDKIRITNGEWPPYLSKHLKFYGVGSHIVTEAFALEGIKVEYGFFPWGRSFKLAESGVWDGAILYSRTPKREKEFYISDPVVPSEYVFFHLKSFSFEWHTLDDLKGLIIGSGQGYDFGPEFDKAEKERRINIFRVTTEKQNLRKLLKGRINLYPQDIVVGYDLINKHLSASEAQKITHHPKPLLEKPQHLLLSKKAKNSKRMLELFNRGLKRLNQSGSVDQYFEASRRGEYIVNK